MSTAALVPGLHAPNDDRFETAFFGNYWRTVTWLIGVNPRHKSAAIQLSDKAPLGLDQQLLVSSLFQSLDGPWWRSPMSRTDGNWAWRTNPSKHRMPSLEVQLERRVVALAPQGTWTFQMSTTSGYRGPRTDKRRAIDLVHRTGDNTFRFIELKIESDNPLYAAFEILGYGLAYCLARKHGTRGSGLHDVMLATRIELEVLAPRSWYAYKLRTRAPWPAFDLAWLASAINTGLSTEIKALKLDGLADMTFNFRTYSRSDDIDLAAAEIAGAAPT